MKKNGFTLIELLAVIVILAIIALIAVPIILNIIRDARESANERSIELYATAVKNAIMKKKIEDPQTEIKGSYTQTNEGRTLTGSTVLNIEYDGDVQCDVIEVLDNYKLKLDDCTVTGVDSSYSYDEENGVTNEGEVTSPSEPETEEPEIVGTLYTITSELTSVTINNSATKLLKGERYSATLTSTTEYGLDTVKVTMGGVDITSSVYNNGIITIENVTGDIVITATAITQFGVDSWETIVSNVQNKNTSLYNVGDTKTITLTSDNTEISGTYTVRIANMSTPTECSKSNFSQTACGFVIEFVDIITNKKMIKYDSDSSEWSGSEMRRYVNNDIYNALPSNLKDGIIDTLVLSGVEVIMSGDDTIEEEISSTDKMYLLSSKEILGYHSGPMSSFQTRQLDYYNNLGIGDKIWPDIRKKYNGSNSSWWLREIYDIESNIYEYIYWHSVAGSDGVAGTYPSNVYGVSPAFRLAE